MVALLLEWLCLWGHWCFRPRLNNLTQERVWLMQMSSRCAGRWTDKVMEGTFVCRIHRIPVPSTTSLDEYVHKKINLCHIFCSWNLQLKKKNIRAPSLSQQDRAQIKSFVRLFFFFCMILTWAFLHEKSWSWTKPLLMPRNPDCPPPPSRLLAPTSNEIRAGPHGFYYPTALLHYISIYEL